MTTRKTPYSYEEVEAIAKDVVASTPRGYFYPGTRDPQDGLFECKYVQGNAPSCAVGHVLHRMGVPLKELKRREGESADQLDGLINVVPDDYNDVMTLLSELQTKQDIGWTWRIALAHARKYVKDIKVGLPYYSRGYNK